MDISSIQSQEDLNKDAKVLEEEDTKPEPPKEEEKPKEEKPKEEKP